MKNSFQHVTFTATCSDLTYEGLGVVRNGKEVFFVPGLFPGDEAEIESADRRAGQSYGQIKRLIKKSPHRIEPRCKICSSCGRTERNAV